MPMLKNFLNQPNVIGRLMIVLLFAGGVVFAGAFDGFVVETQASSCCGGETNTCGGGTDGFIFSSSECCDEEECGICGCYIAGCDDCLSSFISCGGGCKCPTDPNPDPISGNVPDSCQEVCAASTDQTELCNNNCGF